MAGAIAHLQSMREAGIQPGQAEAIARAIEESRGELVTKDELRASLAEMENRLTGKLVTLGISITGIILAGVYFMLNYLRP